MENYFSNILKLVFPPLIAYAFIFSQASATTTTTAPPQEKNKRGADLVELVKLDKTIKLDVRYARADNFVGKIVYPEARAFLQRPAAEAVVRVHRKLKKQNLGLIVFDGYRPWSITRLFWEVTPEDKRKFVADPTVGSRHNRGCAIDLSVYDLRTGKLVDMPSDFDEFTERASPDYKGGSEKQTKNRDMLRQMMEAEGFTVNKNEWWHFDYKDWEQYAIYDISFAVAGGEKGRKPKIEERKDFKRFFDEAKVSGGIYVFDLRQNKYLIYDRARFARPFVPASTSKIIHSLVFLDSGALPSENEILKWDGVKRSVAAWNQDHDLRSALKVSAVWFYVEASKRVGQTAMQNYYDRADYGNRNTSGFGADYWNTGDLRVTPREQIDFLVRFYENRLPFAPAALSTVKDILIQEKTDRYVLRGKTGWSDAFAPQVGWYVGYVERGADAYFFAAEIDITKAEDAAKRAEITKNVLRSLSIIE